MNTVVLEVRSLAETLADAARAMKTGHGDAQARIAFASPELLWKVLSAKAARRVGRDVKAVHGDVSALLDAGVLSRTEDGRIEFPFDAVKVEFLLQAA
jgi:predicted transcriptional regulator